MKDTIYRQDAIDALDCINGAEEVLRSLPSAQPDHIAEVSKKVDADLISRKAAIEALYKKASRLTVAEEYCHEGHVAWSADVVYRDVMEGALLELPPAQSEIIRCKDCIYYDHLVNYSTIGWCRPISILLKYAVKLSQII